MERGKTHPAQLQNARRQIHTVGAVRDLDGYFVTLRKLVVFSRQSKHKTPSKSPAPSHSLCRAKSHLEKAGFPAPGAR
jgi:hypothetical protein